VVAIGLFVGWALHGFGNWRLGRAGAIVAALFCFLAWSAVSAPFAVADTEVAWEQFWAYAKIVLPFIVGITTLRTVRQLKQLAWVIVLSQGYLAFEFNLQYYTSPFFDPNEWTFASLDRNGIAITMVAASAFAFFLGLHTSSRWQKMLALGVSALMVHVVLFSLSRGGMLALIFTAVIMFVLIPKRPATIAVALLAVAVGLRLAGPMVVQRFGTALEGEGHRDDSAQSRLQLWRACVDVFLANPVFGIGSNNWRSVAHLHGFVKGKDAHTLWLHVAAELGLVGIGSLIAFYGLCVVRLWRMGRQLYEQEPWFHGAANMVIASICGFAVSAQFVSVYGVELPFYLVLFGAGVLKLAPTSLHTSQDDARVDLAEAREQESDLDPDRLAIGRSVGAAEE
jgi:O-antigen ligase